VDAPHIVVVADPAYRANLAIDIGELHDLDLIDLQAVRPTG
jgi:hypothetical protein